MISHFIDSVGKPQKLTRMELEQEGIHTIIKYGIACYRKKCKVLMRIDKQ